MFGWLRKKKGGCAHPGYGSATMVCEHLVEGAGLGWFWRDDPADPDASWPDAWCRECNAAVETAATAKVLSAAFREVCDGCYEAFRERNWPADVEGKLAKLVDPAMTELERRHERFAAEQRLSAIDWFDTDEQGGLVLVERAAKREVRTRACSIGSFSKRTNTWLWTWGHSQVAEPHKAPLRPIRQLGVTEGLLKLAVPHWPGSEDDAWDMLAIASRFVDPIGYYRTPTASGHNYWLVLEVERAPS